MNASRIYRELFAKQHLQPTDIRTVEDLPKLPFTRKQHLKDFYPFGLAGGPTRTGHPDSCQ